MCISIYLCEYREKCGKMYTKLTLEWVMVEMIHFFRSIDVILLIKMIVSLKRKEKRKIVTE